jgi:uncharacterized membrane protein
MRQFRLLHNLRTSLWPVPILCVVFGLVLSFVTLAIDDGSTVSLRWSGGPDASLAILGAIAASMITLAGTVLSIVLVVVQLAMDQFSPRIVRAVLHDRPSQWTIGIFAATFAHAMLTMRDIASTEEGAPVPGLAIAVAFLLVVASIVVLILYINHIGQSLRVASLIETVGDEMRDVLEDVYPDHGTVAEHDRDHGVSAPTSGVVFRVDYDDLIKQASRANCTLELIPSHGDFVAAGAPLIRIEGDPSALNHNAVAASVALGPERTMNQDLAYGFRMLVDIAVRSLSDAYDPTTAVQAIDRLHDGLRQLVRRPFPSGEYRDRSGTVRLRVRHMTWDGYVVLSFEEIRQVGADSVQVKRRLKAALEDLLAIAPAERRPPLERQYALIEAIGKHDDTLLNASGEIPADVQGIGSASELQAFVMREPSS